MIVNNDKCSTCKNLIKFVTANSTQDQYICKYGIILQFNVCYFYDEEKK